MYKHVDALIVGAGPAGLAAAVEACSCGLDVVVLDEQPHAGGQLLRNQHLEAGRLALDAHDRQLGQELLHAFETSGAAFFAQTSVWGQHGDEIYCQHKGKAHTFTASQILFAVGGMERPVPFQGWTLPGVVGAGAAEVLLRSGVPVAAPKEAVLLAGNGPLLLSLAVHLIEKNIPIAAWLDTGRFADKLRSLVRMGSIYKDIPYLARGMKMALKVLQHKIPIVTHVDQIEAHGRGSLERVRYKQHGQWHEIATTKLVRHENIIPRVQIASALALDLAWEGTQRYWYPRTDISGRTHQKNILMAGDGAFVYGGEAALAQGRMAGIAMALDLGVISAAEAEKKRASSAQQFRKLCQARGYLRTLFAPNPHIYAVPDETIVCRCECVTAKDIRLAVREGYSTPDEVKRMTRCGMGPCQGRMCGQALAEIMAQELGCAVETLPLVRNRQPFTPVTLVDYCSIFV